MIPIAIQPYFFLLMLGVILILIFKEIVRPSVGFLLGVVILLVTDIMAPRELLAGFSNDKIASIVLLILITSAFRKNFRLERLFDMLFGKTTSYRVFLARMMGQVALLSSFINNTPVVALMTPYVVDWGKKNNISPSKLLIPISYSAIMGGMLTIIGTSTTLLLNGFLDEYALPGINPIPLLIAGACVTAVGILFLTFIGPGLLPNRKDLLVEFEENPKEYLVETHISHDSNLIGQTVKDGGLRNLKGVYLVELIRDGEVIHPVNPGHKIEANDKLFFAGNTNQIVELINSKSGLVLPPGITNQSSFDLHDVAECVVAENSTLVGKTVKKSDFRNRYDAAVVAIHRAGQRLTGKIGDQKLRSGDVLLAYVGENFLEKVDLYRDLYVVNQMAGPVKSTRRQFFALSLIAISIIGLLIAGNLSLFSSLLVIMAIMIIFKLITMREIKRELDLDLIGVLVFSLVIGEAMLKTGAGVLIADNLINFFASWGTIALMAGVMFFTMILTSFVNNAAAISISFPVTYSLIQAQGLDGMPFFLAIAFAASGSFVTPFGYQTNLIIYGPGGYKIKDFVKAGLPTAVIYLAISLAIIVLLFPNTFL